MKAYSKKLKSRFSQFPNDVFSGQIDADYLFARLYDHGLPKSLTDFTLKAELNDALYQITHHFGQTMIAGYSGQVKLAPESGKITYRVYDDDGINYYEFLIIKKDGKTRIGDIYVFSRGEYLSEILAKYYLQNVAESNLISKIYSEEKAEIESRMMFARSRMKLGLYNRAKELLDEIREVYYDDKTWHLLNIECAINLDSTTYMEAIMGFAKSYDDDPSWLLMGIDYYFIIQDWEAALNHLDDLRERVGVDPILFLYESNIYRSMGDFASALKALNIGIRSMPEFENFYNAKYLIQGRLGDYDGLSSTLDLMYEKFDVGVREIDFSLFPDFQNTDHYKNLLKRQS